ncbi:Hypothetical predicted protein [Pelobates cultripes]|uniref:Uncharacterized protein n=1 Tax=Pelobates cultripes TaxID=61616 RepID=A0AAD1T969_PELCU|nr:Hypothetical predicted protein [Pelobates cultripes]
MRQNLKKQKDIQQQIYELSQVRQAEKVGNTKQVHQSKPETGSIVFEHEVPGQKKWKLDLQKSVNMGKQSEKLLYARLRSAEFAYKKKAAMVQNLEHELTKRKQDNSVQVQKLLSEAVKEENDLFLQLSREQAELMKYQNQMQGNHWRLLDHRCRLQEEIHQLEHMDKV